MSQTNKKLKNIFMQNVISAAHRQRVPSASNIQLVIDNIVLIFEELQTVLAQYCGIPYHVVQIKHIKNTIISTHCQMTIVYWKIFNNTRGPQSCAARDFCWCIKQAPKLNVLKNKLKLN